MECKMTVILFLDFWLDVLEIGVITMKIFENEAFYELDTLGELVPFRRMRLESRLEKKLAPVKKNKPKGFITLA